MSSKQKVLQSYQILNKLNVKNTNDGKIIFDFLTNFFVYLPVGDTISTPLVNFKKIDEHFIHLEMKVKKKEIVDTLEKTKIIKIV